MSKEVSSHLKKRNVVLGTLGVTKDAKGRGAKRWQSWRPTLSVVMQDDFTVHRMELLYPPDYLRLAKRISSDIRQVSPETEVVLIEYPVQDPWDFEESYAWLHEFSRHYQTDTDNENYYLNITTGSHVHQICMFMLCEARLFPAQLIQTSPDPENENRAVGQVHTIDLDAAKYDALARRFHDEAISAREFLKEGIQTRNPAFNRMIEEIEQVALVSPAPVLLDGPTGAGKTHLARKIYELKATRGEVNGSFVAVNCATLVGDGAMSALFGHKKGAFTGAISDRDGYLKQADQGVLFLDEIGELGLDEQAMLLHAIEEQQFYPVGSDRIARSRFQLIAGTNRDLINSVEKGEFREDLLARINVWHWALPALTERLEDLEVNIEFELLKMSRSTDKQIRFNSAAKDKYLRFSQGPDATWSANFRDLNASITRMATLSKGGRIDESNVESEIVRLKKRWHPEQKNATKQDSVKLEDYLDENALNAIDVFDQMQLKNVIEVCIDSRSMADAGRKLFNVSRTEKASPNDSHRLRTYLKKFGLSFTQFSA